MKNTIVVIAICILALSAGCRKTTFNGVYTGVVVVNDGCVNQVVECVGPNVFGQSTWVYSPLPGSPVYHHVFAVQNKCNSFTNPVGDTIHFKVIPNVVQNCMCIDVWGGPIPDTSVAIQLVP